MDVTPLISKGRQLIESYGGGAFQIGGQKYVGGVLVFPERTLPWVVEVGEDGGLGTFAPVTESDPPTELLLFGSGDGGKNVPPEIQRALRAAGVVTECMDTGAACRTFNVLLAEGRRVDAALMPIT